MTLTTLGLPCRKGHATHPLDGAGERDPGAVSAVPAINYGRCVVKNLMRALPEWLRRLLHGPMTARRR